MTSTDTHFFIRSPATRPFTKHYHIFVQDWLKQPSRLRYKKCSAVSPSVYQKAFCAVSGDLQLDQLPLNSPSVMIAHSSQRMSAGCRQGRDDQFFKRPHSQSPGHIPVTQTDHFWSITEQEGKGTLCMQPGWVAFNPLPPC